MSAESLYTMTPTEIAWGYVVGHEGASPRLRGAQRDPRVALEDAIRPALLRPPCGVAFSGGRDSSLVLAVATRVARREGLPDPVPLTRRFPAVDATDETQWQELVVRHLGLREWQRLEFSDELDVLGPIATGLLREHGVLWPPSLAAGMPLVEAVAGGSLLDGEGGDEVLGVEAHRIAPLTRLIRRPRPLDRWRLRRALGTLAPARIRVPRVRRRLFSPGSEWLLPDAWSSFMDALDRVEEDQPLSFAASVRRVPRRRSQVLAARNARILAARRDVVVGSPLLDPGFVGALAVDGGILGHVDRTAALLSSWSDVLPEELLSRVSKASFTVAYMGRPTIAFAESWDGTGLDTELVDPEHLRAIWLSDVPYAPTSALLQAAWLASLTTTERRSLP